MRLIDADAFERKLLGMSESEIWTDCLENVISALDEQPTIEERKGKWIDHQYKEFPIGRYECSVCGAKHDMEWDYCPNCGAKMEVKE